MKLSDLNRIKRMSDVYETKETNESCCNEKSTKINNMNQTSQNCNKEFLDFLVPAGILIALSSLLIGALLNQPALLIIGSLIGLIVMFIGFKTSKPDHSSM